jgi:hypothetical protein
MTQDKSAPSSDLFQDETTIPESDWFKFEKIGDTAQGTLLEEPQYGVPGKFGPQNIYTLETADGRVIMVGLNPASHVRAVRQLKQADVGDMVAMRYTGDYDSGKGNPGKSIDVRIKHVSPEAAVKAAGM